MKTPHTSTYRGKRVRIILRNGRKFVDRFIERTDRQIHLKNEGWIDKSELRAFTIWKAQG